jgi:hypothetical protein
MQLGDVFINSFINIAELSAEGKNLYKCSHSDKGKLCSAQLGKIGFKIAERTGLLHAK